MLGVQYLWIDKLCIIQHDEEDWAREGSRMASIFEGSFLTIGAAVSPNDTASLFFRDTKHASSLKNHVGRTRDGHSSTIHSRIPLGCHPADSSSSNQIREDYPLMTRAWVYQEKLLAPRILYFGEELSWECREASACECSGAGNGAKHGHSLSLAPAYPAEKLHLKWQDIVEEFTWLQLSHEQDRLPALSGLAQQYQSRLKSAYLAGLWRTNLITDLMWFAYPDLSKNPKRYSTQKLQTWRAPSWSWASLEGPIRFCRTLQIAKAEHDVENVTYWVEIVSATCTPSSLDPLGTVASGRLALRGRSRESFLQHRENCTGRETRQFSITHSSPRFSYIRSNFTVEGHEVDVDYDLINHGLMEPNSDMSIHCLDLATMSLTRQVFISENATYKACLVYKTWSLLLRRVHDDCFERVGFLASEHSMADEMSTPDNLHDYLFTIV